MFKNKLKLYPDKSELMLTGNKCHNSLNKSRSPAAGANNLGV